MKAMLRIFPAALLMLAAVVSQAQSLVFLHTNDTHSHIDAERGVGGVLQRKAIIDSVRRAEKNVMVIDAGDIVQGSLYYKLFGGEVEYPLMQLLGYDLQVLGNHEFDNGVDALARYYEKDAPVKLSSNYDFSATSLRDVFRPWFIKKIGGKKVGFMGINLDPKGIIGEANSRGVVYRDIISTADSTAALLRDKGCSLVVAVSHIGYTDGTGRGLTTDSILAASTRGIDIIIGGHSHDVVSPDSDLPNLVNNLDGRPVLIAQTGRYGANLGYIKVDLSHIDAAHMQARLIPVAGIDSSRYDRKVMQYLAPYAAAVDSINRHSIAMCAVDMINSKKYAESVRLSNMAADIAAYYTNAKLDSISSPELPASIDLAIINSGGIRLPFAKGAVTEGQVLSAFPFVNRLVVVEMSGANLLALLQEAYKQGGQAVSAGTIVAIDEAGRVHGVMIDGAPLDAARTYYVATLDYLAAGGDYLSEFTKGKVLWIDESDFCWPVMQYITRLGRAGIALDPDPLSRYVKAVDF